MSQARVYTTAKVRKDWTCGKCGAEIRKGVDGRRSFSVGFRGPENTRCMRTECTPSRSELESSAVAAVYDVLDSIDTSTAVTAEDLEGLRDEVAEALREVAQEYESNEMFEINEDLQERAEMLNSSADELEGWTPDEDEPEGDIACSDCDGSGTVEVEVEGSSVPNEENCEACSGTGYLPDEERDNQHEEWLDAARASLDDALSAVEIP